MTTPDVPTTGYFISEVKTFRDVTRALESIRRLIEVPLWNARDIQTVPVDDTSKADGAVLAYANATGNLEYNTLAALFPVVDTTAIISGSDDDTKLLRFEVDGLSASTTRVITMPDQDVDLTPDTGTFAAATHAPRHQSGGGDPIKLDDLATPDNNTDLNATITEHGLLPILDDDATHFLDGAGAWSTPDHGSIGGLGDVADHAGYLAIDGSRALTANWDAGSYKITAATLESDIATGTAPLTVASTTTVTNLDADTVDGSHAAAFAAAGHNHDGSYYTETELDAGQLDNRYFTEAEHLDSSVGGADAGKPIKLDVAGHVDATMINDGDVDHVNIANIGSNTHAQIDTHLASTANPHSVDIDDVTPTTTKGDIIVENGSNAVRLAVGSNDQVLTADSGEATGVKWAAAAGGVTGPGSSTDNAIARWNGAGGATLQDSGVLIDDSNNLTMPTNLKTYYRDTDIFIHSNADGYLTIEANTQVIIGVAGNIDLGDSTLRVMRPQTDEKIDLGDTTHRFNDGFFLGQVGIGGNPATSAVLTLTATDGALLLPRMTTAQQNALTAANGMILYNTTTNKIQGYENGSWVDI
jgi:hypothetical protein